MKTPEFTIEPFTEKHRNSALAIALDTGLSPWSLNDYDAELRRSDSVMLAAVADGETVGFIVGRRVPGMREAPDVEIYNIGVAPAFQRSGVGGGLMAEFLRRSVGAGVDQAWLEVRAANKSAILFYRSFGFRECAVRPKFYRNPADDAVTMSLDLNNCDGC